VVLPDQREGWLGHVWTPVPDTDGEEPLEERARSAIVDVIDARQQELEAIAFALDDGDQDATERTFGRMYEP
jgi:hypothetical protein